MKPKILLWFDKKKNQYVTEQAICDHCLNQVTSVGYYIEKINSLHLWSDGVTCVNCAGRDKLDSYGSLKRFVVTKPSKASVPVFPTKRIDLNTFKENGDVFSVADNTIASEKIIDKTKYSSLPNNTRLKTIANCNKADGRGESNG